jgi:hypothetical protein
VGVGPQHHIAGDDQPFLGEQDVLDAAPPLVEEPFQAVLFGKLADDAALLGRLDVLGGHEVREHERHPVGVEQLPGPDLFELADGDGSGNVVAHEKIQPAIDDLARVDRLGAGVIGQDLLGDRHHGPISLMRWAPAWAARFSALR